MCHHLAAANTMRIATCNFHLGETRIQKRPRQQNRYHPNSALRRAAGWRESREEKVGLALGQWRETLLDCDLRRQRDTESLRGCLWILENLGCEGVRDHLRGEPASLSVLPRPRQHASRRRGHASVWLTQKKRGAGTMLSPMWGPWHLLTGPSGFCLRQNKS